jgi:hypothetical protein
MAYTIANIRTLIQDPEGSDQFLSNDDYSLILSLESNIYLAVSMAATMIAEQYALKADTDIKGASLKNSQKRDAWLAIASRWSTKASDGSGEDVGEDTGSSGIPGPIMTGVSNSDMKKNKLDPDIYPSQFSVGQDDNSFIDWIEEK